jgi:hypothetical protein
MTAILLAHAEHVAPHGGTDAFIGVALLLMGAVTALWRTRRRTRGLGDFESDEQMLLSRVLL